MDQVERTFFGRAYGMDIRVDKHEDGSLSVYETFPYSALTARLAIVRQP